MKDNSIPYSRIYSKLHTIDLCSTKCRPQWKITRREENTRHKKKLEKGELVKNRDFLTANIDLRRVELILYFKKLGTTVHLSKAKPMWYQY
jgi:hypothetical protein